MMQALTYQMLMYIINPPNTFSQAWSPPSGGGGIADSAVNVDLASICASLSPATSWLLAVSSRRWMSSWIEDEGRLMSSCETALSLTTCFSSTSDWDIACKAASSSFLFLNPTGRPFISSASYADAQYLVTNFLPMGICRSYDCSDSLSDSGVCVPSHAAHPKFQNK